MTDVEIGAFLRGARWGVLATSGVNGPYAVPVAFAFDDGVCYVASGPGLKADNIGRSPAVCLTVVEVADPPAGGWRSVVIRGSAEAVSGVLDKTRGFLALRRQFNRDARLTARDLRRYATAGLLRITPTEHGAHAGAVTGRAPACGSLRRPRNSRHPRKNPRHGG